MDSWEELEHQLWYKKNLSDEEINSELNLCAAGQSYLALLYTESGCEIGKS